MTEVIDDRQKKLQKANDETYAKTVGRFAGFDVVRGNDYADELSIEVPKENLVEVCRYLHDDKDMAYDYIVDICSVDFPSDSNRFVMVYCFFSISRAHRIRVKVRVGMNDLSVDSVCCIWKGAEFMEDEVYDMMGIRFENHPDLRRIFMPEEFDGYPLRKDFPVKGKGWRHEFDFIPTMVEEV